MKYLQWLIIGIGVATGAFFLLGKIFNAQLSVILTVLIIFLFIINAAAGVGYLTNRLLFQRIRYNVHVAIMMPWASVFMVLIIISGLLGQPVDWVVSIPLTFVIASVGGAYGCRQKHKASTGEQIQNKIR